MISDFTRIPQDRIGALIGKNGEIKKQIEKKTGTKIKIDSTDGEIEVTAKEANERFFKAKDIVKAIGRGFSPRKALKLLEPNHSLYIIELGEVASTKKGLAHKRGRVIGESGRARQKIEEITNAEISVFGKTIAIIGTQKEINKAKKAVEMLLSGYSHTKAFDSLNPEREMKKFEL